ncbi:MAG: hypothetical protein SGPRY_004822 [Prymnesium sp.]
MSPYLVSLRVESRRNFTDSPFTPSLDAAGRAAVERGAIALFDSLPHELRGGYHPLASLDEQTALSLREEGLLFSQPDSVAIWAGAGASNPTEEESGWGAHRGVFRAAEGKFAILVNEEDHLRLVSYRQDSDLLAAFSTLADSLHALERAHALPSIAASARRGFLTVSPSNVGTGLRVTLTLRLPMLGKDKGTLEAVCSQLLQQVSKSAVLVGPAATSPPPSTLPSLSSAVGPSEADADGGHLWDVSSKASVGMTEVLLVQGMVSMALRLVELERRLAAGACLLDAMTPPPPPPDPPPVLLARATRRCSSLRTFGLSGRPLPVRDWCGEASRLSLGTGALTNQDALFLAQLLRDHTSLRSLHLSQCRLTGPVAMQMVHSLAASFAATKTLHKPLQLSELRLDGNRLRVCGALALFEALEETVCPLHTLDLSATELCGGTVSLARVFGELRGSAVRISDDGHTALLGADGLCSVGPLLERDSGCYHVEWLASDPDGAYVGLITPQAKTSSYPGADAYGIGWRAKGGVRHKHNSIFEASALAWGKEDRVGLRLDTSSNTLSLYKNGELLPGSQQAAFNDAGSAGVYFCMGRYYGTVELQCLFVSRVGGPDSMEFSALEALCTRIVPKLPLRTLLLRQNQLAGADPIGGGERNEAGLRLLLSMLKSETPCALTSLDLSRNLLSDADGNALLSCALSRARSVGEEHSLATLRLDQWDVPVRTLAAGCEGALELCAHNMSPADGRLLASVMREERRLVPTAIDLSRNPLGAEVHVVLHTAAELGLRLSALRLAGVGLHAIGAATVIRSLRFLPALTSLDLSDNPLTAKEARLVGGEGSSVSVDGSEPANSFTIEAIEALADLLNGTGGQGEGRQLQLRSIRLCNVQLCGGVAHAGQRVEAAGRYEPRGAVALAAAIRSCSHPLTDLCLSANRLRDSEAASLAAALGERAREGLLLTLDHNALSPAGLASLQEQLPASCTLAAHLQQPRCEQSRLESSADNDNHPLSIAESLSQPSTIYSVAASADGGFVFLALAGGGLLRTQLQPCALDGRLEGHTDDVNCVEVWRGLVVSGSDDRTVRVWKADGSGQEACIATLEGHTARIWYTLTTDDYIYSASADNTVCVWDAHAATVGVAALVTRLEGHSDTVFALAVAAGFIYSGSADKCIKQWSSSSHTLCQSWQAHDVSRKIRPCELFFSIH